MKTYRQREKQGSKVQESTKGPDEAKIKVKLDWGSCDDNKFNDEIGWGFPTPPMFSRKFLQFHFFIFKLVSWK